mgnify:CR=1 FL=1
MNTMKFYVLLFLFFMVTILVRAQDERFTGTKNWAAMAKVTYKIVDDQFGEMSIPEFSKQVESMAGEEIELTGYLVPLDGLKGVFNPDHFILSSLPLSACFFCGVGGPESVVEVYLEEPIEYTTEPITLKGKLRLNYNDPYQMIYIIDNAEFVGVVN